MSGLKIGWDQSSLNALKTQLSDQINKITQQKIELGVDIKDDKAIKQLNSILDAVKNVQNTASKSVDLQVNTVKTKQDLAGIKGNFEDIINTYKQMGQISVNPTFDKNGMIKDFTIKLQQLNGLVDKIKYNANEFMDGKNLTPISFSVDNIKEINNLDQTLNNVDNFKSKYNNAVKQLQGIKIDSIVGLQKQLDSLNINNFEEKSNQIKNTYNELSKASKEYTDNLKLQQNTQNFIDQQQSRLNNVKNNYGSKLDINSSQYKELENTYNAINSAINRTRGANEVLSSTEQQGLRQSISDLDKKQSKIVSITNAIKQQEIALNNLKSKFGNIIPESKINQIRSEMQKLYTSTNFKGDSGNIDSQIKKLKELGTEVQRIKGMGSNLGSFNSTGINMDSNFKEIENFISNTTNAKASISSINESVDSLGNKMKTVSYTINEGKNVISKHKITLDSDTEAVYNLNTGLQNVSTSSKSFASNMSDTIEGLVGYTAALTAVYGGINQIKEAIQDVMNISKNQTNIQMITGMNQQQVKGLTEQFSDLATQVHSTTGEMMSGAENFLRAGNSIGETKNLLKASSFGATLSGQDTKTVSDQLIAMANGFKMNTSNAKEMMTVIDKLTKTDNSSASSFAEMATSMSKSADMAKSAKVDFNHLLAYESTVSSVTREDPSSIGRSFSTMFSRFLNVKGGQKFDAFSGDDLSNVERDLKRYANINLRSDPKTFKSYETVIDELSKKWKNLDEVSKSAISKAFAGAENANNFQALMNNLDQVDKNLKDMGDSAGYAQKKMDIFADSPEAKLKSFQHAVEDLHTSLVSSSTINKSLQGLTSFIQSLDTITTSAPKSGIALAGIGTAMILIIKNAKILSGSGIITFFKLLPVAMAETGGMSALLSTSFTGLAASIKAVSLAFLTNPITWIIAALGVAGVAIIKHIQHQKDLKQQTDNLKQSYSGLTEAMKENDVAGIKSNTSDLKKTQENLQKLIKQRNDIQGQMQDPSFGISIAGKNIVGNSPDLDKLAKVNNQIKEQEKVLKDAGLAFNSTTGEIYKYTEAEQQIGINDTVEKISKTSQAEISHKDNIISLGNEYKKLQQISVPNAEIQDKMSTIANKLSGEVSGLVTQKDKDGNVTIKNTGLLNAEIGILGKEGVSVQDLIKIKLDASKQAQDIQVGETTMTYQQATARMKILQEEAYNTKALYSMPGWSKETKDSAKKTASGYTDAASKISNSLSEVNKIYEEAKKSIEDDSKADEDNSDAEDDNSKEKEDNTDATDANTQATKLNEEMQKRATQAVKEATNVMKAYEDEINKVQLAIKNYDYTLGTMNDHSNEYIATLEKKKKALQEQLALTNKNIAANNANAASLKNMANQYAGVNYTLSSTEGSSSSSGGSASGKYASYINKASATYGVPTALIQAIIQQESGWNPNATSGAGAKGLMQKMEGYNLYDPYSNIMQGTQELAQDLKALGGNISLALAAYNAGLGAVKKYGGIPPYKETQQYVPSVLALYRQYGGSGSSASGSTTTTTTGLVSGEDAANTAQSGYESLLSQVESLQQSIPDLKAQIDQVAWAELEAKEGQFDDKINSYAKFIEAVKTKADMYNEGSKEKVEFLKQEWQDMNVQYSAYNEKQKFIENQMRTGGWNANYIQQLQSQLIELKATEQQALQTLQQAFDDWITADYQAKTQIYQDKLDTLQQQYDLLDTKDKDNYQGKLDIAKEELEQQLKIKAAREDELSYVKQLISNEKYGTTNQVWLKEQDTINKDLLDTNKNIADIENTIADLELSNKLKSYENDITNLKAKLQELDNVTDKGYNDKIDIINKIISDDEKQNDIISKRIKLLQDEANRFADGSEEKIELLDQVNTLEQKQNDIQQDRIDQYKQLEEQTENQVLDLVEKQIYGGQTKQEFEDAAKARENAIDAELKAMDKQEQNLQEQETRDKNLLDLEEARVKLQQDQNERNVQQLTQDKNGNWNWTYVANQTTVDQDEKDLRDKQTSNNDWERQTAQQHQQDTLNDEKEQLEQEVQIRQETMDRIKQNIEDAFNDQKDLFSTGQTDINKIVTDSLSQMENLYGSTFGNITSTVSTSVQSILSDLGKLNPNFVNAQNGINGVINPTETTGEGHVVYGSGADLANAKNILGSNGYTYVDISDSNFDKSKAELTSDDILLGGAAVTQGMDLGLGTRLWGQNRYDTQQQIAQYGINQGGTYVVVGSGSDLANAKTAFGDKYQYIDIGDMSEEARSGLKLQGGDLVVGGQGVTEGLNLNGATRLSGTNRQETANAIFDYVSGEAAQKIKIYATGADYQNAVKTLDSSLYDVIDTASKEVSKIQLNAGDVVVGGGLANQLQGQIQQSGATAIYGKDRNATLSDLEKFKQQQLGTQKKYDQLTTQQTNLSTTQQTVIVKDSQTKESYAINVGANTNLATVTQSMSNINDVTYNGMGQMVVTVQDNVNQAIDAINQLLAAQAAAGISPGSYSPTQAGNVDTRPVVFAKGSDAAILKAQYGDSINIQYGTGFSGQAGTTRYDTNKTYQDYLATNYGIVPNNKNVDLSKFDTGGYTGDWAGDSGKLAVLHKKEMILNPNDTENFMILVKALEEANTEQLNMSHNIVPFTASDLSGNISNISNDNSSTQEININVAKVEFPNATNSDDIIDAFTYKLPAKVVKMQ
ncbi:phage tail tape measure protein [Clostridium tyrobutyricum]|uniref:phage tail tape measure protein n=1 Tax=Clostridium tyrobutyricum TaxID=1519 RepID=UPI0010AA1518|nr:phage tail tape measure protein [Clostridium tyrobutyricum]QCH29003.1 Soluble lytic murein transglycosylase precursor [Clostridium tyrobutyricum]